MEVSQKGNVVTTGQNLDLLTVAQLSEAIGASAGVGLFISLRSLTGLGGVRMIDDSQDMTPGDVKLALKCSLQHATKLMKAEMGAIDIGTGKVPRWRVSRENFTEWHERKEAEARTACGSGRSLWGRS